MHSILRVAAAATLLALGACVTTTAPTPAATPMVVTPATTVPAGTTVILPRP